MRVLKDVTNPSRATNINGVGLSQLNLQRVGKEHAHHAERALLEVARRLLGQRSALHQQLGHDRAGEGPAAEDREDTVQQVVWASTTKYLAGRIQASPEEMPGRTPDMSPAAAAAMRAVLREVGQY